MELTKFVARLMWTLPGIRQAQIVSPNHQSPEKTTDKKGGFHQPKNARSRATKPLGLRAAIDRNRRATVAALTCAPKWQ